tara:strand:+ start:281 stop:931 length:651 start_codon:yes stop_codon:yes gene_type:complete
MDYSMRSLVLFVVFTAIILVGGIFLVVNALYAKQKARFDGIDCEDAGNLSRADISNSTKRSKTSKWIIMIIWWLSLLSYIIALVMPFGFFGEYPGGGFGALLIGWIYFFLWIPNPLYFLGLIYLKKGHWNKAMLFAILAVAISGYWIITDPVFHPHTFLEWSGPVAFVWFGSFCLLLLACLCGWASIPIKHKNSNTTILKHLLQGIKDDYGNEITN